MRLRERGEREGREGKGGAKRQKVSPHRVWDLMKEGTRKRGRNLGVALQKPRRGYFMEERAHWGDALQGSVK